MDFDSERSAHESVEDNVVVSQGTVSHVYDDNSVKINGSYVNELVSSDNHDANVAPVDCKETGDQGLAMKSPTGGSPPMKKGYGLKKWRRIKRDFVKDAGPSVDSSKILKRGLSGAVNPTTPLADNWQNNKASVGFPNALKTVGVVDGFATRGSSSDSRFAVGSAFAAGTDSENSEDRSSKSSTAASAPKLRYELPAASVYVRERNRMKNLSGKSGGNPTQRVQQGKSRAESSKKPRGEKVKIEKENSHSSMESDSRSSNFVFMQGASAMTSNGRQSGRSVNYDGENSDDAHASDQQFSEEVQTGYAEENVGVVEDLSQDDLAADLSWDAKDEKNEDHQPSTVRDPLVESLLTLQSVQDELEKEVEKLGEIGKDAILLHDNSFEGSSIPADSIFTDPQIHGLSSSNKFRSEKNGEGASGSLEMLVLSLKQNVQHLEAKLEEMRTLLEVKELRVAELEATLNSSKPGKEESGSTIDLQPELCREMETEFECLFRQKIEAEVEYLTLTSTIDKVRAAGGGQVTLIEEQEALALEQAQMLIKLEETECKAAVLEKQAEELGKYCRHVLGEEVVLKMQNRVCKVTTCFVIQFLLLVLVFWLFVLRLSSHSGVIVPT